jgi:hypothetical protein
MTLLNIWSVSHFFIWFIAGRYTRVSWGIFWVLSIAWEVFEWLIDDASWASFAVEPIENKLSDLVINAMGFWVGRYAKFTDSKHQENEISNENLIQGHSR